MRNVPLIEMSFKIEIPTIEEGTSDLLASEKTK